jgi:CheY-like chemotaxis protein
MVTHELSSSATGLVGCADLLAAGNCPDAERPRLLTAIAEEGRRLLTIIHEFLDARDLEQGRLATTPRPTDLRTLVEHAAILARADRGHTLVVDLPESLPLVHADPDRVQQVLANLLSNARKYTPAGGEIRLTGRVLGGMIEVSVADDGLGIPAEALPHLFEKFYRVQSEDRRAIRGTGLGLAIVKELIQIHGGQVGAESEGPAQGSRFWFTLPLVDAAAGQPHVAETGSPEDDGAVHPLRILAVDDEPAIANVVTRVLRLDGHHITAVRSGEEALGELRRQSFDVVISDLGLGPGMDGWQLADHVRRAWPDLRIVLASGSEGIDPAEARRRGVDELLGKPYRSADLRYLLRRLARQVLPQEAW